MRDEIALALTAACPVCAEQPGDPCTQWPLFLRMAEPHPERYDVAQSIQAIEERRRNPDAQPLSEAEIQATGLV